MYRFKSAILEKLKNCQNGTFEPVHEIWNFFWPKVFFWSIMKMPIRKNIHNMPQGLPNPGFKQEKVQKDIARIEIFLFILGSYESLECLES